MGVLGRYDTLVWDFNGTLLDDVDLGIECANEMLARRGLPVIPDRDRGQGRVPADGRSVPPPEAGKCP